MIWALRRGIVFDMPKKSRRTWRRERIGDYRLSDGRRMRLKLAVFGESAQNWALWMSIRVLKINKFYVCNLCFYLTSRFYLAIVIFSRSRIDSWPRIKSIGKLWKQSSLRVYRLEAQQRRTCWHWHFHPRREKKVDYYDEAWEEEDGGERDVY